MATDAGTPRTVLLHGGPLAGTTTDWYDGQSEKLIRAGVKGAGADLVGIWAHYVWNPLTNRPEYDPEGSINNA